MRASGQEQVSEEVAGQSSGSLGEAAVPSNGRDVLALVPKHMEAADALAFRKPGA
jgi:hypothetical protein